VKFIPRPIVIGFHNGIAILIAAPRSKTSSAKTGQIPASFGYASRQLAHSFPTLTYEAAALAVGTVLDHRDLPGISNRIPGAIVAMSLEPLLSPFHLRSQLLELGSVEFPAVCLISISSIPLN